MLQIHRIEVKTDREELKQKKMTDIFFSTKEGTPASSSSSSSSSKSADDQFILNRRISLWLCKDLLSFKTIENRGFKDFWASLGFGFKLPTRTTVSVSGLDDIYKCLKSELIIKLSDKNIGLCNNNISTYFYDIFSNVKTETGLIFFHFIEHCAISFDSYTDKHRHRAFNTYTYHFIDDNWCLESRVLKTSLFEGSHTGQNLCEDFNRMVAEYGLENKKIVCVTDSAANMVCACRLIGCKRCPCIAHKSNSLVQKDMMAHSSSNTLRNLLKKVREGQSKLLYRHEQLKEMRNEDNQNALSLLFHEMADAEQAIDAERQFSEDFDPNQFDNDFTGLKSLNEIRWNCIHKFCKCYLDNQSE